MSAAVNPSVSAPAIAADGQPQSSASVARKRSATDASLGASRLPFCPQQQPCHFPPAHCADFVIHYRQADFHVHKFLLCYHSAYFRTYLEQLTAGKRAVSPDECSGHPSIAHCIRLPDQCGKERADEDDFRLFLCHLYFACHYECVPFQPDDCGVDLTTEPNSEFTLEAQPFADGSDLEVVIAPPLIPDDGQPDVEEAVLSLCHYFDCAQLLSRAEDNILLVVDHCLDYCMTHNMDCAWKTLLSHFEIALRFDLKRVKTASMSRIAKICVKHPCRIKDLDRLKPLLDKDTAFAVMQAALGVAAKMLGDSEQDEEQKE